MPDLDLDARLDALFATEPKDFTAARDLLARELKGADRADDAAAVKALRKPTVAVAAVNRIARTHADQVAALVEIGDELAAIQSDAGADRDELRDLTRQRRTLLHQLTEDAAATTERPDGARSSVGATLDTASLDEHLRDDLLRGRLTQELTPATRFVLGDDASPPAPWAAPRKATRSKDAGAPPRDELAARRARASSKRPANVSRKPKSPCRNMRTRPPRRPSGWTPPTDTSPTSKPHSPTRAPSWPRPSGSSATRNALNVALAPSRSASSPRSTPQNAWPASRRARSASARVDPGARRCRGRRDASRRH